MFQSFGFRCIESCFKKQSRTHRYCGHKYVDDKQIHVFMLDEIPDLDYSSQGLSDGSGRHARCRLHIKRHLTCSSGQPGRAGIWTSDLRSLADLLYLLSYSRPVNTFAHFRILWELVEVVELILLSWPVQEQVHAAPSVTMVIYPGYHSEQLAWIIMPENWFKPEVSRMTHKHRFELQAVEDVTEKQPCWTTCNKQKTYFPSWRYS